MKNFGAKWLALAAVVGAATGLSLNGCGGGSSGGTGKGGSAGGRGGAGGSSAGTGGSSTAGRGGSTAGTGGSTAGTGGSAGGTTGSGGAVGGAPGCTPLAGFATDLEGFAHNQYNTGPTNLYLIEGGAPATLVFDPNNGSPAVGSMRTEAPFTDYKQFIDLQKGYDTAMTKDWTGFKLHVRIKIASGLNPDPAVPTGIQPYASSYNGVDGGTPGYHFKGNYQSAVAGNGWNEYIVDVGTPKDDYDPSKVVNFGVLIQSGDGNATAAKPTPAVIYIDSFWLEGSCGGTGGTGGTGGGTAGAGGTAGGAGGTAGTAGSTAGTGGSAGTGGTNNDGGTTAAFSYLFDTTNEGFGLNNYNGTGNLVNVEGGTPPSLGFDANAGNPNNGSLKVTATFTGYNQFVLSSLNLSPGVNGKNKTVHAWVMVDAATGGGANFGGGAQILANAVGYVGANGPYTTLTPGQWKEITLDLGAAHTSNASFDDSQIIQLSIQFHSGGQPEGGTFAGPVNAVFHVDTITDGSGGGPPPLLSHTFDTNAQLYALNTNITTPDGGVAPALSFDSTVGDPSAGSLKIVATFTNYNQNFDAWVNIQPTVNLTGKTLKARVRIDSGSVPSGYVQLHASSTGYKYASGGGATLTAGSFVDLTMNMASPSYMDTGWTAAEIIQIGLQIGVGGGPEGGTFPTPTPLTFHIDSIIAQ